MSMGTSMGDGNSFSFKSRLYQVGCTVVQQCDACSLVLFAKKPSAFRTLLSMAWCVSIQWHETFIAGDASHTAVSTRTLPCTGYLVPGTSKYIIFARDHSSAAACIAAVASGPQQ